MEKKAEETKGVVFHRQKHEEYLFMLDKTEEKDAIGYYTNDHLKVSGGYWCITALLLLRSKGDLKKTEMISFLQKCGSASGGYGGNVSHDPCMTSTHYVVLLLSTYEAIHDPAAINIDKVAQYVSHLQDRSNGSFKGDDWGETDLRFSYCAASCLTLFDKLGLIDVDKACEHILRCRNPDGAFGGVPGAESHAAYTFCAVGALAIFKRLHLIDLDQLGQWLAKRQTPEGGFNGRPEKLPDVCYSWWILSTLYMIDRHHWCNKEALRTFILRCQDEESGGFADRPGNEPDVFHTFFGLAALSLMGYYELAPIDALFAIPRETIVKVFPHVTN